MSVRHVKRRDEGVLSPATDCVAHRCDEHSDAPPINDKGPEQSECALCVADELVRRYEKQFEMRVFWPILTTARDRLNLMAPDAGNKFIDEARALLQDVGIREPPQVYLHLERVHDRQQFQVAINDDSPSTIELEAGIYLVEILEEDI